MSKQIRRSLLFMPGDDRRKIEKAAGLEVDTVIMDLEDGVAFSQKEAARKSIRSALKELNFGQTERLVRINPVVDEQGLWQDDIQDTIEGRPAGYVLPKVENAEQVQAASVLLHKLERKYGWIDGSTCLLATVETAKGIINLKEIASSDPRLSALVFGAEDLAGDIGAIRTPDGWEVFYARSALVLHAKAYGLQAIDTPFVDLTAEDSNLIAETEQAHYMGYTGKLAIHPRQIEPIQKVFTPTESQINKAQALIDAFNTHQEQGAGVFAYEGKMVDMPMVRAAKTVLENARATGIDLTQLNEE